jgi:hypothetical protein
MDSTALPFPTVTADATRREQPFPDGEPSLEPVFLPVQQSLAQVYIWCHHESQLLVLFPLWLAWQPHWSDYRLTLCQAGLLGSTVLILYGTTQWMRLFHAIDWTGPAEAIQSALEKMRALRLRQLGLMAVLLPLILTSATLLLIQHTITFADAPEDSVFTALEPWPPLLLLAVILAMVLMARFARRKLQEGWPTHRLRQQLVDGGSGEVLARVLRNCEPRDAPAEPAHVAMGAGSVAAESPPILGQNESPPRETAHGSESPQTSAGREPVLDTDEFRESILQPVRTRQKQFVVWRLFEIVCSVALLLFCVAFWGRFADPKMSLCLGIGLASSLAYLMLHSFCLHGVFSLDWNASLEEIQSKLERLRIMRIRHLRWTPVIAMLVLPCLMLALFQLTFDSLQGSSESVLDHDNVWRIAWSTVIFMFLGWFYFIPFERLAFLRNAGARSVGDCGVLAAFDRARREIERWESRPAADSVRPHH